jgi:hypothetical protein
MRVNRGGQLAPADIYGRDRFIEDLWRELEQTSVVLKALYAARFIVSFPKVGLDHFWESYDDVPYCR